MSWYNFLFKKNEMESENKLEALLAEDTELEKKIVELDTPSYFSDKEMKCKCGCDSCDMDINFLCMLNKARAIDGKPWKINSAYRCSKHNASVGGKKTSAHLHGCAADISAPTSARKFEIVSAAMQAGFNRIGVGKNFVHLDSDTSAGHPANVLWTY